MSYQCVKCKKTVGKNQLLRRVIIERGRTVWVYLYCKSCFDSFKSMFEKWSKK